MDLGFSARSNYIVADAVAAALTRGKKSAEANMTNAGRMMAECLISRNTRTDLLNQIDTIESGTGEAANLSNTSQSADISEPRKSSSTHAFRLMDLPAELQLRIFEYAATDSFPICITAQVWQATGSEARAIGRANSQEGRERQFTAKAATQPPLTRVCRSIRTDTLKFYYRNNHFEAGMCCREGEREVTQSWLKCIGAQNRREIRSLIASDPGLDRELGRDQRLYIPQDAEVYNCIKSMREVFEALGGRMGECMETATLSRRTITFAVEQ